MAKNKNQNTVWLVILAVVLLFIWLNASPKSSQVGAQESQSEFDGEFDRGVAERSDIGGGGGENFLPSDQEGGRRVGVFNFNPGSKFDRLFCGGGQGGGGGGNCEIHNDDGHLHFFRHSC